MESAARYIVVALAAVLATALLGACGGGSGDGGPARASVSGLVLHAADGSGVGNATVVLGDASVVTNSEGEYVLPVVAPGRHSMTVSRDGFVQPGAPIAVDIVARNNRLDPVALVAVGDVPPDAPPDL